MNKRILETLIVNKDKMQLCDVVFLDCYNLTAITDGTMPAMTTRISESNQCFIAKRE